MNDSFDDRIKYIKELIKKGKLDPIINYSISAIETELFINKKNDNNSDNYEYYSDKNDIRYILKKKYIDLCTAVSQMGAKLEYIKSGSTGHIFKGISIDNNEMISNNFAVKMVAYPKKDIYGGMYDSNRPENAELKMIKLLSYFVINKVSPHIILPICTFNTSILPFVNLIEKNTISKDNIKYNEFIDKYNKNHYNENVSILITEWANRGDFLDFLKKHYKKLKIRHWKVFFFQILSVLAIIQNKYPKFRHNDLKANNILIEKLPKENHEALRYRIKNVEFKVPFIGFRLKLWDFDFACIPDIIDNYKVALEWTNELNITTTKNRYYDIHFFLNTLIRKGFLPQIMDINNSHQELIDFINRIIPNKYPNYQTGKYIHKRGRILHNKEYKKPIDILIHDDFFLEFRINKIKRKI
jgi:hypothetical protein